MKRTKNILLLTTLLLSTQAYATVYEDAEDERTSRWSVYDNTPSGAYLENVYLADRDHNAIQLIGSGIHNGYILGNWEGSEGAWNNTSEHTIKWSMRFDEPYMVYVRVMTQEGGRYIQYTPSNTDSGKEGNYIKIGLGEESSNGTWQDFTRDLEADLKKYEPNNALVAVNAFLVRGSGLVDDIELVDTSTTPVTEVNFTPNQRLIADKIISVFENSTTTLMYGYAEHIDDQHGITAGRAGFTSATGDMLMVVERYVAEKPNDNPLAQYIPELKRLHTIYANHDYESSSQGANVANLEGLIDDWKISANDPLFREIQDDIVNTLYFNPALKEARKIGAKLPITLLNIYDANIQHGMDGVRDIISQISVPQPKNAGDEIAWLKAFNAIRLDVMLHTTIDGNKIWEDSIYRQHELVDMIKEGNYNLDPFTMRIQDWGDEEFDLSTN